MPISHSITRLRLSALLCIGGCLAAGLATAAITPIGVHTSLLMNGHTSTDPRAAVWHYQMSLLSSPAAEGLSERRSSANFGAGNLLLTGGRFMLQGFMGYVDRSCIAPTGWRCEATEIGLTDLGAMGEWRGVDLTWTYSGERLTGTEDGLALGMFSAESMFIGTGTVAWSASGLPSWPGNGVTKSSPPWLSTGNIFGPGSQQQVIPEPSSLALGALGLGLIAGLGWLFRPVRPVRSKGDALAPKPARRFRRRRI